MTVILGEDERDVDRFRVVLGEDAAAVTSVQDLQTHVDTNPGEDLVIIGPHASMPSATDFAARYRLQRPSLGVVLLRQRVEVSILSEAIRAGIREVVAADDVEGLVSASRRSLSLSREIRGVADEDADGQRGEVILVFGPKGGCGKTMVATNLAQALSETGLGRVCLIDLKLDFGDVAISLHVTPTVTISQAVSMQGELDQRAVASIITAYQPDFDVVLAPVSPAEAEFIGAELAADIVGNLARMYRFVVIDGPSSFSDITLRCLDIADQYVLMTTMDVPALKSLKVALETMDTLGYPRAKWRVVLNRADAKVGLTMADVEEMLGIPVTVSIPSSGDVPASMNAGVTIISTKPGHPVSSAIRRLAALEAGIDDPGGHRRRRRLFGRRRP
ncbi:MAG: AAA family ATPase [Actinomycetota bacterium]|nr:AAA family ATPase [Actinomycetota bacterium]